MKTGDTVRDPGGRTFQVGQLIGRGLWGKTYTAREEPAGTEWVLKTPLGLDAFSADSEEMARLCREIALEQARVLGQATTPGLIRVEARFVTESGVPVLILPRLAHSLQARMDAGISMGDLLRAIAAAAQALRSAEPTLRSHGNLRPSNILADGRGGWVLADPLTDTMRRHLPALARARGIGLSWLPPEARSRHEATAVDSSIDSYTLALHVLRAAMTPTDSTPPPAPEDGLDKATLVALKDAVRNRLATEASNPRFHARFAERLSTLLNRALSREASPSPPYRFPKLDEFGARLDELASLVNPSITHVGRLLLDRPPGTSAYTTDEEIAFSCSAGCSAGVESHEDIACGLAVFDLQADKRLRDLPCSYTVDRHPSGRFRFGFRVARLPPGSYKVRLAFTIRDGGHEPQTAEGEFQIQAAPGYVPPANEPEPKAIRFAPRSEPDPVTETGAVPPPRPSAAAQAQAVARVEASRPAVAAAPLAPPPPVTTAAEPSAVVVSLPRPMAPGSDDEQAPFDIPISPRRAPTLEPSPEPEPEYRGAGRWTDLPLPSLGGPGPIGPDPFEHEPTEPMAPTPPTLLDRLMASVEGEHYKVFLGLAIVVILLLIAALLILR